MILASFILKRYLKVHSCKLYNNKYMITSTQITNIEIFAFVAVLVFTSLSFVYKKEKTIETVKKWATF